jgi:hypothetical protein
MVGEPALATRAGLGLEAIDEVDHRRRDEVSLHEVERISIRASELESRIFMEV